MIVKKCLQSLGRLGTLRIQRNTVRSERSKPSIFSSPWIRGAPQVEYSATVRRISSRNSLLTHFFASPNPTPREPLPIQLEPCTVPANNSLWPDEDQCVLPPRPEPPQDHPGQLVGGGDLRARIPLIQNGKLLAKSQVLRQQVAARAKDADKKDN
jgi:hypothetical protein